MSAGPASGKFAKALGVPSPVLSVSPVVLSAAGRDGDLTLRVTEAFALSPGADWLVTLFGGEHLLAGISGCLVTETTDENPGRVAAVQRLTWAYLRSALYPAETTPGPQHAPPCWTALDRSAELMANDDGTARSPPSRGSALVGRCDRDAGRTPRPTRRRVADRGSPGPRGGPAHAVLGIRA